MALFDEFLTMNRTAGTDHPVVSVRMSYADRNLIDELAARYNVSRMHLLRSVIVALTTGHAVRFTPTGDVKVNV